MDRFFLKLKKILPGISKNVLLKNHTTFKIGGPAKYFLATNQDGQITKALRLAKKNNLPFFILAGGSNVLVSDKGFNGLIIKIEDKNPKLKIVKNGNNFLIRASAGVSMGKLVKFSADKSLSGLQWAGGLPGTIGGAVRGNAGAFGGETKDNILEVRAIDDNFKIIKLSNKECNFYYRSSVFKEKNWIVLSAVLQFKKGDKKSIWQIANSNMNYRKEKQPLEYPSAGSIFKNCDFEKFSQEQKNNLLNVVKKDPFPVVPAAHLLSEAGLKGKKIGGAMISPKHPNFIVNMGNASAKDVLGLIDFCQKIIKEKYGINLDPEVQYIN